MGELTIPSIMPKVFSDVGASKIDPAVMNFVIQCAQLGQLKKLREDIRETNPIATGIVEFNNLDITASDYREIHMPDTLMGLSIYNAGPNSVKLWVNSTSYPGVSLSIGQTINLNYGKRLVENVFFVTESGETATVSIKGQH